MRDRKVSGGRLGLGSHGLLGTKYRLFLLGSIIMLLSDTVQINCIFLFH